MKFPRTDHCLKAYGSNSKKSAQSAVKIVIQDGLNICGSHQSGNRKMPKLASSTVALCTSKKIWALRPENPSDTEKLTVLYSLRIIRWIVLTGEERADPHRAQVYGTSQNVIIPRQHQGQNLRSLNNRLRGLEVRAEVRGPHPLDWTIRKKR